MQIVIHVDRTLDHEHCFYQLQGPCYTQLSDDDCHHDSVMSIGRISCRLSERHGQA